MNLLIDIGNTKTSVYIEEKEGEFTKVNINSKNNSMIINELEILTNKYVYDNVLISSVVPDVEVLIYSYFQNKNVHVHSLNYKDFPLFLNYQTDDYTNMGCDRVIVDFAAIQKYGKNCIVFDIGTALTIDVIYNTTYLNGYIFPGIDLNKRILIEGATLLDDFKFRSLREDNMCLDTISQLNDGIIYGSLGAIKVYIQENISHFKGEDYKIILTGGTMYFLEQYISIKRVEEIIGYDIIVDYDLMSYGLSKAINKIKE